MIEDTVIYLVMEYGTSKTKSHSFRQFEDIQLGQQLQRAADSVKNSRDEPNYQRQPLYIYIKATEYHRHFTLQ